MQLIQETRRIIIILAIAVVRGISEVRKKLEEPIEMSDRVTYHDCLKLIVLTEMKHASNCNNRRGISNNDATVKRPSPCAKKGKAQRKRRKIVLGIINATRF